MVHLARQLSEHGKHSEATVTGTVTGGTGEALAWLASYWTAYNCVSIVSQQIKEQKVNVHNIMLHS